MSVWTIINDKKSRVLVSNFENSSFPSMMGALPICMGIPFPRVFIQKPLNQGKKPLTSVGENTYTYSFICCIYLWIRKKYKCNSGKNWFNYNPSFMTHCCLSCMALSIYLFIDFKKINNTHEPITQYLRCSNLLLPNPIPCAPTN